MSRTTLRRVHAGKYVAEVMVELIEEDAPWGPYLSPDDVKKLDAVRKALREGDTATAAKYGRVYELLPVLA
jgi:hypothetical protein